MDAWFQDQFQKMTDTLSQEIRERHIATVRDLKKYIDAKLDKTDKNEEDRFVKLEGQGRIKKTQTDDEEDKEVEETKEEKEEEEGDVEKEEGENGDKKEKEEEEKKGIGKVDEGEEEDEDEEEIEEVETPERPRVGRGSSEGSIAFGDTSGGSFQEWMAKVMFEQLSPIKLSSQQMAAHAAGSPQSSLPLPIPFTSTPISQSLGQSYVFNQKKALKRKSGGSGEPGQGPGQTSILSFTKTPVCMDEPYVKLEAIPVPSTISLPGSVRPPGVPASKGTKLSLKAPRSEFSKEMNLFIESELDHWDWKGGETVASAILSKGEKAGIFQPGRFSLKTVVEKIKNMKKSRK